MAEPAGPPAASGALPPLGLPEPVARAVLSALNHVLGQNAWAARALAEHDGAGVRLRVRGPLGDVESCGRIAAGGLLEPVDDVDAPCRVVLTVALTPALLPALLSDGAAAVLRSVRVEGDAELAATLGRIVQSARWDAEEDLSRVVGDIAARRLLETGAAFASAARAGAERLQASTRGYLVDEDPQLVAHAAFDEFRGELRLLRDDLDRFEKRLELRERSVG